jgi:ferredoxin
MGLVKDLEAARAEIDREIRHAEAVERARGIRQSAFRVDWARCQRCGLCFDACPRKVNAIKWSDGQLAEIDQDKCIRCGNCEAACPPRFSAIARTPGDPDRTDGPIYRVIEDQCEKCGLCWKRCPVDAIAWKRKELAVIDEELCVRCGRCKEVCPDKWDAVEELFPEA